jgi:hypothetical protein
MGPLGTVPDTLQILALKLYRSAAKVTALCLHGHQIVESVYVHRSVATGEIVFGRSDIDLLLFVRQPDPESGDGPELASLYQWVKTLRRLNPALQHILVQETPGVERSFRTDTYGASMLRRSVILLAGKPVPMPDWPVRREDAVRRLVTWPEAFLSPAVRQRNRRNLAKLAADMWNAFAVARGWIAEPCRTRKETVARARMFEPGAELADLARSAERAARFALELIRRMHGELLPPLEPLKQPLVFRTALPPRSGHRLVVVWPDAGCPPPPEASEPSAFLVTPELLHLYLHYVNPFLAWTLPPELERLGFTAPSPREYVRAGLNLCFDFTTRFPGFLHEETWMPGATAAFCEYSLPYLQNGEVPPAMPEQAVRALMGHRPSCREYYEKDFAGVYKRTANVWSALDRLDGGMQNRPAD